MGQSQIQGKTVGKEIKVLSGVTSYAYDLQIIYIENKHTFLADVETPFGVATGHFSPFSIDNCNTNDHMFE